MIKVLRNSSKPEKIHAHQKLKKKNSSQFNLPANSPFKQTGKLADFFGCQYFHEPKYYKVESNSWRNPNPKLSLTQVNQMVIECNCKKHMLQYSKSEPWSMTIQKDILFFFSFSCINNKLYNCNQPSDNKLIITLKTIIQISQWIS